jgi:hypothetical protein
MATWNFDHLAHINLEWKYGCPIVANSIEEENEAKYAQ